jgi:TonB family protein
MGMRLLIAPLRYALGLILLAGVFAISGGNAWGQQKTAANATNQTTTSGPAALTPAQIDAVVRAFTAKETEFRHALNSYAFKRDALLQALGMGGQIIGEYHRVSNFTFDDQGARTEKIQFFPMPSFTGITQEDIEDLGGVNPFALEAAKIDQYNFKYVGKERIDELDLYIFDVTPKVMPKKTFPRFFSGRIWVDDRDLQIVKSRGKGVPETKENKFPIVETYREQIDGKYWFPTYSYADDDLVFDNGQDLRLRMRIKYTDYQVGHSKVKITEVEEASAESIRRAQSESQTTANGPRPIGPIDGGNLNSKAIELPPPIYPAEARKIHASGQVQIKVIVDETGRVLSADILSGPETLRMAALAAARKARFAPTLISGGAVKVSGILTYDFKPE